MIAENFNNLKISMPLLKAAFERAGLRNVVTYINSGNVIFETRDASVVNLASMIEKVIAEDFGFPVAVLVLDAPTFRRIHSRIPEDWKNDDVMKTDIMFLWQEADRVTIVKDLGPVEGVDTLIYEPGAVVWNLSRSLYGKSRMNKLVGTKLYKQMTVRNVNTVRKLHALLN